MRNSRICLFILMAVSMPAMSEVKIYQSTDNTGINKKEQIDTVEKYLIDLSGTLKNMEATLNQNSTRLKTLEANVQAHDIQLKQIKESIAALDKKVNPASGSTTAAAKTEAPAVTEKEIENINADILAIKNKDIEQLRTDTQAMKSAISQIQQLLKITPK